MTLLGQQKNELSSSAWKLVQLKSRAKAVSYVKCTNLRTDLQGHAIIVFQE